jgi:hypothetical protein
MDFSLTPDQQNIQEAILKHCSAHGADQPAHDPELLCREGPRPAQIVLIGADTGED